MTLHSKSGLIETCNIEYREIVIPRRFLSVEHGYQDGNSDVPRWTCSFETNFFRQAFSNTDLDVSLANDRVRFKPVSNCNTNG